jgi:surface antigen
VDPIHCTKRGSRAVVWGLAVLGAMAGIAAGLPATAQAVTLRWEPSANLFWAVNGRALLSVFQNGQCTEWAADKRPDVVKDIVVSTVAQELRQGLSEALPNFDARNWARMARNAGLPTGHEPKVGALMVFQPGVLGAGSAGHIAYVKSVRKRSFTVSEMHAPLLFQVSYETFSTSIARLRGVRFIYRF